MARRRMRCALLALDLDGTLLAPDGTVHPDDAEAVTRAENAGIAVTLATGRVATGTLPTARALGLRTPLVCADGSLLVDPVSGERILQRGLPLSVVDDTVATLDARSLTPFVLMHDAVHRDLRGAAFERFVTIWTENVHIHADLGRAEAWRREGEVALTVGVGLEHDVDEAASHLRQRHEAIEVFTFRVRSSTEKTHAILVRADGCTKAAGLARIAAQLGVTPDQVAVVGDWFNDVSMFRWAGRSFAMAQAPEAVQREATDVLTASTTTGRGVAEAIAHLLRPVDAAVVRG